MSPEQPTTEKIASRIRYWMVIQKDAERSPQLRDALGVSAQKARDLYFGRKAFTIDELDEVAAWLGVPLDRLIEDAESGSMPDPRLAPSSQRPRPRLQEKAESADDDLEKLAQRLGRAATGLAALIWNPSDGGQDYDFLDTLLFNEIDALADLDRSSAAKVSYCFRMTLHELADQINLFMPNRPQMEPPAVG